MFGNFFQKLGNLFTGSGFVDDDEERRRKQQQASRPAANSNNQQYQPPTLSFPGAPQINRPQPQQQDKPKLATASKPEEKKPSDEDKARAFRMQDYLSKHPNAPVSRDVRPATNRRPQPTLSLNVPGTKQQSFLEVPDRSNPKSAAQQRAEQEKLWSEGFKDKNEKDNQIFSRQASQYGNSFGKAVLEAPKFVASLPASLAGVANWIGESSERAGNEFGQWLRNDDEVTRDKRRAALEVKQSRDNFLDKLADTLNTPVENVATATGLNKRIEDTDKALDINRRELYRLHGGKNTAMDLLPEIGGEVVGNIAGPAEIVGGLKSLSSIPKLFRKEAGELATGSTKGPHITAGERPPRETPGATADTPRRDPSSPVLEPTTPRGKPEAITSANPDYVPPTTPRPQLATGVNNVPEQGVPNPTQAPELTTPPARPPEVDPRMQQAQQAIDEAAVKPPETPPTMATAPIESPQASQARAIAEQPTPVNTEAVQQAMAREAQQQAPTEFMQRQMAKNELGQTVDASNGRVLSNDELAREGLPPQNTPRIETEAAPNYFREDSEISDINRILKNEDTAAGGEPIADYYRRAKGEDWSVEEMSPDEYLDRAARAVGQDPQSWRNAPTGNVEEYAAAMRRGDKFPMPFINKVAGTQEGRTRALAAKAAGQERMNVAVGKKYSPEPSTSTAKTPVGGSTNAPNTRRKAAQMIEDESLREDLLTNAPPKEAKSLKEAEANAIKNIAQKSDEQLVGNDYHVKDSESFFNAMHSLRRLEDIDTPEAREAIARAVDAMSDFSAQSGRGLRTTQVLWDNMPSTMKANTLIKKLNRAGKDLTEDETEELLSLVKKSDAHNESLDKLRAELNSNLDKMASGGKYNRAKNLEIAKKIDKLEYQKDIGAGKVFDFFDKQMPKSALGGRVGEGLRTAMLSAPSGRLFDILSTTSTTASDALARAGSNVAGKFINMKKGAGTVEDTLTLRGVSRGFKQGMKTISDSWKGTRKVSNLDDALRRRTRSDAQTTGNDNTLARWIKTGVEAPTHGTTGIKTNALYRSSVQEGKRLGLRGRKLRDYAEARQYVPTSKEIDRAHQLHMRANMLHENVISRGLNNFARTLDGKDGLSWLSPILRNQIAPFTSWLGGNLHRTLTDKNVLWNAGSIINKARKGDMQGMADDIGRLAGNTVEALALGGTLTAAGILTTTDANGDDYEGLYLHVGNRYIPVAVLGSASVPLILGNAVATADKNASGPAEWTENMINTVGTNILKNTGVSSVLGGDNPLQNALVDTAKGRKTITEGLGTVAGNISRQVVPAISGDINAGLNMTGLNPTGELADTKVTYKNPDTGRDKTDILGTEVNKTLNRIPFVSQTLPRREGTTAQDLLDRPLKSTHETSSQIQAKADAQAAEDKEADREARGISYKDEAIKAARENGEWDKAAESVRWKLERKLEAGPVAKSTRTALENEAKTYELLKKDDISVDLYTKYSTYSSKDGGVTLTAWRKLTASDNKKDKQLAKDLYDLDSKLYKAGLVSSRKYYPAKIGGRGRGRGRGSAGRQGPRGLASGQLPSSFASFETGSKYAKAAPTFKPIPDLQTPGSQQVVPKGRTISIKKGVHL